MLATIAGDLCLLLGLAVLLLPLLATELSRPRDGVWGGVVLLLGLVLVTSSDRLRGAPMLAVICSALLISRLGAEVAQSRWQHLSQEEQKRLRSKERWATSVQQLGTSFTTLLSNIGSAFGSLKPEPPAANREEGSNRSGKRWVRPEDSNQQGTPEQTPSAALEKPKEVSAPKSASEDG
ncbi:putative N-terminaldomain of isoleucyl-tRNA synthetase [Synechococcus sp. BIOS-E4-1]|uniref:Ycf66 family protein n=1 Tax=Synechococcus sp. BIOS-E4-1 TaxID=1400864 RepID=UPI0016471161|nr:Ycf66 family protein [Synechococcus sp. BIOS-E4-1]QNI52994.1 putative N-terminaldomain of isoleucyl-tRNA synthetase [Synechococcus sp. BIOS-E4-1]